MDKLIKDKINFYLEEEQKNFLMVFKLWSGMIILISFLFFYFLNLKMSLINSLLITIFVDSCLIFFIYLILNFLNKKYLKFAFPDNYFCKVSKIVDYYIYPKENSLDYEYFVQLEGENQYRKTYRWVYSKISKNKNCTIVLDGKEDINDNWVKLIVY